MTNNREHEKALAKKKTISTNQLTLLAFMEWASEEFFAASWLIGLEDILPDCCYETYPGGPYVKDVYRDLCKKAGGTWVWGDKDEGRKFVVDSNLPWMACSFSTASNSALSVFRSAIRTMRKLHSE